MTTIAYRDGIFAYDSRTMQGSVIVDSHAKKLTIAKGVAFILCGARSDEERLIAAYFGEPAGKHVDCSAYVIDQGRIYEISVDNDTGFWKCPLDLRKHRACGSGAPYALTAMDMGADAVTAVRMAILRDSNSGGRINTYQVQAPSGGATR